jgi:hypothetical protein
MQRFENLMLLSGSILMGYAGLVYAFNAIEPISWLAPVLLILTAICAASTIYYARTETPTQVEVWEYSGSRTPPVIH